VRTAVDQLEETLGKEMKKLLLEAELNWVQMFAVDVTLDTDTAHLLSDDCKYVHHSAVKTSSRKVQRDLIPVAVSWENRVSPPKDFTLRFK